MEQVVVGAPSVCSIPSPPVKYGRNPAPRWPPSVEKAELRAQLREQLNVILETRETARGLIVNLSDVLFDFDKATLRPGAHEKLAKIPGIILAHPGLRMEAEGHADAVGTDDYNQRLSERRAQSVSAFLVEQGIGREKRDRDGIR